MRTERQECEECLSGEEENGAVEVAMGHTGNERLNVDTGRREHVQLAGRHGECDHERVETEVIKAKMHRSSLRDLVVIHTGGGE